MLPHTIIGLAADHAGFGCKEHIRDYLIQQGVEVKDFGTCSEESMDYPDVAHPLAEAVARKTVTAGVAFCGTGNGMVMTLNRHKGVRAGLSWTPAIAQLIRRHNDANICVVPARFVDAYTAQQIVTAFLSATFEGGRHLRRIEKIEMYP
ncbi:MAG: RpiB/LacA/LacB family sugar-phosphate isomerase [Prevotellaceae bacterium]|jgi:ribose 5-phosphate isomerase B|nr:RpiB/LacA/LacB family sugar-phosphate isomerase [Prevotellaceae bacterium]